MNKQPIYYMQTDPRWSKKPYNAPGEDTTIGRAGCGPTCAAMIITTMTGKSFLPPDACEWAVNHGYKAPPGMGTYYSYFKPQFAEFGITAYQLNWKNLMDYPDESMHERAFRFLKEGYYLIACMGPGLWTKGGHFVVVWWKDNKVLINDPASRSVARTHGDFRLFKSQVKYYFVVNAVDFNREEEDVTKEEVQKMIDENKPRVYRSLDEIPSWFKKAVEWAIDGGVIHGDQNGSLHLTDDNLVNLQMLYNYANITRYADNQPISSQDS